MTTPRSVDDGRRVPWKVLISAYCVPVLIVTQFAFLAAVPVLVLLVSTFRNVSSSLLRWLAILLSVVYTTPYALWKFGPNPAVSFSKDIHPAFATLIIAVSVVFIVAIHVVSRRGSRASNEPTPEDRTNFEASDQAEARHDLRERHLPTEALLTEKEISRAVGILLAVALGAMALLGFLVRRLGAPPELLDIGVTVSLVVGVIWGLMSWRRRLQTRRRSTGP